MHFDSSTPRVDRKFSGIDFKVPFPFTEGHALTKGETAWMNSNAASVIGNAFSGDIRRGLKAYNDKAKANLSKADAKNYVEVTDPAVLGWDFQGEFDAKYADYVMGESNRGSGTGAGSDPLSQLVRMFSTVDIKTRLAAKNLKVAPFYKAGSTVAEDGTKYPSVAALEAAGAKPKYATKWEELIQENILAKGDQFRAQAQAQLDSIAATDTPVGDDDLLGDLEEGTDAVSTESDEPTETEGQVAAE